MAQEYPCRRSSLKAKKSPPRTNFLHHILVLRNPHYPPSSCLKVLWAFLHAVLWIQSLPQNTLAGLTSRSTGFQVSETQGGCFFSFSISQILQFSLDPRSYLSCSLLLECGLSRPHRHCWPLGHRVGRRVSCGLQTCSLCPAHRHKASGPARSSACPSHLQHPPQHHRDFTLHPHTPSKL